MTDISGKAAVVTGGGSGIGKGLAMELARQGVAVAIADIFPDKAQAVADQILAAGGRAVAIYCDVCDRASVNAMRDQAIETLGPIQLVFANAGATSFTDLVSMSDEDVDWIIQVNLMGVMYTTRAFLPQMIKAGGGHICATASMAGVFPGWIPDHVPYAAAKAGIIGLMMNLQLEMRKHNIFTTSYCPGAVASGMKENNGSYRPERFGGPETVSAVQFSSADSTHADHPFYRPEDVAPIVLNGVKNNRPFVFDHAEQRPLFHETYSSVVEACYDDIEAWESRHGTPEPNPYGAALQN